MSIAVTPPISTTGAVVGQNLGPISLSQIQAPGTPAQQGSGDVDHIILYNESQCGLVVTMNPSGRSFRVPAGAWSDPVQVTIRGTQDQTINLQVEYTLANPLVMQVGCDYFYPGEEPISSHTLGNSPIGGSLNTPIANSLVNTTNSSPTPVITTQSTEIASGGWAVNNDGSFTFKILHNGVSFGWLAVLQGVGLGPATILLGNAGIQSAILATITLENVLSDGGSLVSDGSANLTATNGSFSVSGTGNLIPSAANTGAMLYQAAANALELYSAQNGGSGTGIIFNTWTGAVSAQPLSLGSGIGAAKTNIDNNGNVTSGGWFAGALGNAGAIASNATLVTSNLSGTRCNPAGAVTGIVLGAGSLHDQKFTVYNESANTITFAAAGTSRVADGATSPMAALTMRTFGWDNGTSLWYRAA